jgi:glycosyltransferase involved in cell wall biosynthesis
VQAASYNLQSAIAEPLARSAPSWSPYAPAERVAAPRLAEPGLPLVGVAMPSLNQGRYIGEAIASVLTQSYPNIELWVIDGGSGDETLEVVRSFAADQRLRWLSERDRGQSDAINKGWARCHGQILAWLNADDTYLPGAVATQVQALLADQGAAAVYGDARYTAADGRPLGLIAGRPYTPLAVLRLEIPVQPTVFLRREVVASVGPLSLARRYSMDTDYWARVIRRAPLRQSRAEIATYRLHAESKTVSQQQGFYREWLAIAEQFFADPSVAADLRAARPGVLADIYAVMANLEARSGTLGDAARYLAYALTLAGPRPRALKLPLALLDRALPLGLAPRATALWGRLRRGRPQNPGQ